MAILHWDVSRATRQRPRRFHSSHPAYRAFGCFTSAFYAYRMQGPFHGRRSASDDMTDAVLGLRNLVIIVPGGLGMFTALQSGDRIDTLFPKSSLHFRAA